MQQTVLSVKDLSKIYKTFRKQEGLMGTLRSFVKRETVSVEAVSNVSFEIKRGEFVGLLGPNGAGKTTTLKILAGLIRPTSGGATAFGSYRTEQRAHAYLRKIGMVMGQRNQLNPDLPAMDSFRLVQAIYDLDDKRMRARVALCAELFSIQDKLQVPVRKLSLGERMKMELILALLHEPELLFLDEPTIGLDFNAARQIRAFLKQASKELNITVILTSHYTKDIEELCERVIIINHGRIHYDGTLQKLDPRVQGQKIINLAFDNTADAQVFVQTKSKELAEYADVQITAEDQREVKITLSQNELAKLMREIFGKAGQYRIEDLKVGEKPLEEIFSELYKSTGKKVN